MRCRPHATVNGRNNKHAESTRLGKITHRLNKKTRLQGESEGKKATKLTENPHWQSLLQALKGGEFDPYNLDGKKLKQAVALEYTKNTVHFSITRYDDEKVVIIGYAFNKPLKVIDQTFQVEQRQATGLV